MRIVIVSEHYPFEGEPQFTFVQQLAYSMSNLGHHCIIIAPQSIPKVILNRERKKPLNSIDLSPDKKAIEVYRPRIVTFSNSKNRLLKFCSIFSWKKAILKVLKKIDPVDVLYCYFWHVGLTVSYATSKISIPIVVQASECAIAIPNLLKKENLLKRICGVVCASGKNLEESTKAGLLKFLSPTCICTAVNGYRKDEFYSSDRHQARLKKHFPQNIFIVAFVGGFIERKGILQLCAALERFDDVYTIFIGKGPEMPSCKNILFAGTLPHNQIVEYLNCADIFVLPTEAEGCCNAIIEAVACGLPVISSNKKFNDEIIDETCSIRIDEHNVDEIYNAIRLLKEDASYRKKLSEGAIYKSNELTIEHRAKTISNFLLQLKKSSK